MVRRVARMSDGADTPSTQTSSPCRTRGQKNQKLMTSYCYEALDTTGATTQGTLEGTDQGEILRRIKEMGLFPTRIAEKRRLIRNRSPARMRFLHARSASSRFSLIPGGRVRPKALTVFTRQLATLVEAGMPLLRGLRLLQEQEEKPALKCLIGEVAASIESGNSLSESLAAHPKVFGPLSVNLVKAGELSGALDVTLRRLADFLEQANRIKGKVKAALFYPAAVLCVATAIVGLLLGFVVPRFLQVFHDLRPDAALPAFTTAVLDISQAIQHHFVLGGIIVLALVAALTAARHTTSGRWWLDRLKLRLPLLGRVHRKAAVARFTRTLGTLLGNGVPILQALTIVKGITGNVVVGHAIGAIHDSVEEGDTVAAPLRASGVFPALVAGMVDVGEQTGALPDMLLKIADNYDAEVDNAVTAMTSLLEPIMIILLAIIVGCIVVAMFLPILWFETNSPGPNGADL